MFGPQLRAEVRNVFFLFGGKIIRSVLTTEARDEGQSVKMASIEQEC